MVTWHDDVAGESERLGRLHMLHGEDSIELRAASTGAICAVTGLRATRTGDTLLLRPGHECATFRLPELTTPTPVFFRAVEVASAAQQPDLDAALC